VPSKNKSEAEGSSHKQRAGKEGVSVQACGKKKDEGFNGPEDSF
jgi:hypothetical protein